MTGLDQIGSVVKTLLSTGACRATKYLSYRLTVVATRPLYKGSAPRKNERSTTVIVTVGRPNYESREFLRLVKKAGEPFPVKKIQLKFPVRH